MHDSQDKRDKERVCVADAETVLDPRLADLWAAIWAEPGPGRGRAVPIELAGALLRLAYLTGYQDALTEEDRGGLFKILGLPVPSRLRPGPAGRRPSR